MTAADRRAVFWAFVFFALYALLGCWVSHAPPSAFDRAGERLIGCGVGFALALTRIGMLPTYTVICIALLIFAFVRRAWLARVCSSIAALIVAWGASDLGKFFFARPRMEHWIAIHETSSSYASGHATLSLVFYGLWARFLARSDMPVTIRRLLTALLVLLIIGIGWSRAALGAHYLTDILGGYALGGALLCAASRVYRPVSACA